MCPQLLAAINFVESAFDKVRNDDAVLRHANRIARDPRAFLVYYSWQVYIKTRHGARRITGPR